MGGEKQEVPSILRNGRKPMARINVVIPVIRWDLVWKLLIQISCNKVLPFKVLIIDNAVSGYNVFPDYRFKIEVVQPAKNLGVNASWNYGLEVFKGKGHLCIMNDDVEIHPTFFEKVIESFNLKKDIGAVCPLTTNKREEFRETFEKINLVRMKRREGWAFTLKEDMVNKMPPIPYRLKTFFGDDWFWRHTYWSGRKWYKDNSNLIFHAVGSSMKTLSSLRYQLNREKKIFKSLMEELGNGQN